MHRATLTGDGSPRVQATQPVRRRWRRRQHPFRSQADRGEQNNQAAPHLTVPSAAGEDLVPTDYPYLNAVMTGLTQRGVSVDPTARSNEAVQSHQTFSTVPHGTQQPEVSCVCKSWSQGTYSTGASSEFKEVKELTRHKGLPRVSIFLYLRARRKRLQFPSRQWKRHWGTSPSPGRPLWRPGDVPQQSQNNDNDDSQAPSQQNRVVCFWGGTLSGFYGSLGEGIVWSISIRLTEWFALLCYLLARFVCFWLLGLALGWALLLNGYRGPFCPGVSAKSVLHFGTVRWYFKPSSPENECPDTASFVFCICTTIYVLLLVQKFNTWRIQVASAYLCQIIINICRSWLDNWKEISF